MVMIHSQSLLAAVSISSFLLVAMLPSMLSAFRLDTVGNELVSYRDIDDESVERHGEWKRNLPFLVRLLRSIYNWESVGSNEVEDSPRANSASLLNSLTSEQDQALHELLASFSDVSQGLDDVKAQARRPEDKGESLSSSSSSSSADDSETLMTSKRGRGEIYGAMPPLQELCRMMGLRRCN